MSKKKKNEQLDDLETAYTKSIEPVLDSKEEKIKDLEKEILSLRKTLEQYGIETVTPIEDVEYICIQGIKKLIALSENVGLTKDEATTLDTLHKNLRIARGQMEKKELDDKVTDIKDLIKIVEK